VPFVLDLDERQEPRRQQLLALRTLRRDLERSAARRGPARSTPMAVISPDLVRDLEELIEALDRRAPQGDRAEEDSIARDAAQLRRRAVKRLEQISDGPESSKPTRRGGR
jgi:hypothetical protein